MEESHPFLIPRDSTWFEQACGSFKEEVTGPEKQTDGGGAQILLGQSIQKKKEGIFGKPAWVTPELPCSERSAIALT